MASNSSSNQNESNDMPKFTPDPWEEPSQGETSSSQSSYNPSQMAAMMGFDDDKPSSIDEPQSSSAAEDFNPNRMAAMMGLEEDADDDLPQEAKADIAALNVAPDKDPVDVRTQRAFRNKPLAKVGLVGGGTFVIFLVVSSFLSSFYGGGSSQLPLVQNQGESDTRLSQSEREAELARQLEESERERAISKQEDEIRGIRSRPKEDEETAKKEDPQPQRVAASPPPRRPAPQPPNIAQVARNFTPVRRQPVSPPPPVRPRPVVRPAPVAPPPAPPVVQQPQEPPEVLWANAGSVGSYGVQPISRSSNSRSNNSQLSTRQPANISQAVNVNEENAVLSNRPVLPPKQLGLGTRISGRLATPIFWDDSQLQDQTQASNDRFLIVLDEDLLATDNSVAFPAGTQLVGQLASYTGSGLIRANITAVVKDDGFGVREVSLPANLLSLIGEGGKPLVAKAKRTGGGGGSPVLDFIGQTVLGAGRGVARELNSEATSITRGGDQTTVDFDDDVNIAGGALEGVSDSLLDVLNTNRRGRILRNSRNPTVRFWQAKAGTKVEIVVNRSAPVFGLSYTPVENQPHA